MLVQTPAQLTLPAMQPVLVHHVLMDNISTMAIVSSVLLFLLAVSPVTREVLQTVSSV